MYVSIDIETLGLDPDNNDVIEFGAVIDDLKSPIDSLPTYHCYITKEIYRGNAYAMSMHPQILKRIASREAGFRYLQPEYLDSAFCSWLKYNGFDYNDYYCEETDEKLQVTKITVAGKNFSGFDLRFLRRLPNWGKTVKIKHRVIDPAMLYFDPFTMNTPPDLGYCLKMAGIEKEVSHCAVDDALDVIRCLRFKWNISA